MPDNTNDAFKAIAPALGKGCLIGVGIAALFTVVGLVIYFAALLFQLPEKITLLVAIAGGPIIGTVLTLLILWRRAKQTPPPTKEGPDETASRD